MNDDLPPGLREATTVNYGVGKKHDEVEKKPAAKPAVSQVQDQANPKVNPLLDLGRELMEAGNRVNKGTQNLHPELQADTLLPPPNTISLHAPASSASGTQESSEDVAPGLTTAKDVSYIKKSPEPESDSNLLSNQLKGELGVGALVGTYVARKQQKANAAGDKYAHLPIDERPLDQGSLQRYINGALRYQVPIEKIEELTGVSIRTPKEAQAAIKVIQGSEAQRIPVKKNINQPNRPVAYRSIPGTPSIDISSFGKPTNFMSRVRDVIAEGTRSAGNVATNYGRPIAGGMVAAPQLMESATNAIQGKPVDWTQVLSGFGGLGMMTQNKPLGFLGGLAQVPYAYTHKDELLNNMTMHDISPLAFPAGTAESTSSPMEEPTSFGAISGVLQKANEEQRKKLGYR